MAERLICTGDIVGIENTGGGISETGNHCVFVRSGGLQISRFYGGVYRVSGGGSSVIE